MVFSITGYEILFNSRFVLATIMMYTIVRLVFFRGVEVEYKNIQDVNAMAMLIFKTFSGAKVSMDKIEWYIWMKTPFVFRKKPLNILQKTGRILKVYPENTERRNGTFPDVEAIEFDMFR